MSLQQAMNLIHPDYIPFFWEGGCLYPSYVSSASTPVCSL